jgi:hypothetical protein
MAELLRLVTGFVKMIEDGVGLLSQLFGLGLSEVDIALVTGIIVAGIVGFIVFRVIIWWNHATAVFRPQFVVHLTAQTPWQVFLASVWAFLRLAFLVLALALFLLWRSGNLDALIASLSRGE